MQLYTIGSDATIYCNGVGSYLYWVINGVNSEDMTFKERELNFRGYYNHYPAYYYVDVITMIVILNT